MSTSQLGSPRKIVDLGAGITACAWLGSQGLVAFLTSRPARLVVAPVGATSGEPIDLPRITAQEVALLSKDVALVRDKEGTVWSVPIADPYRVREVVRDMRTLLPRPSGEGALAISDDGKLITLTLGRGEVSARPAEVSGQIRAAHVGPGVTYLLAEGEQGGQLRVIPGTALERIPSARVSLPAEASAFDQVRGGGAFGVVFKRGEASLCVVTQGGERAEAALVTLEGPIADVTVTETSVVVAFASGKLALYEAATLVAPGEGPKEPASTVAAGGKGRPRVLLATTTKGATSIWVGTAEGEVLRAAVEEVEVAAPEPAKVEVVAPLVQGASNEEIEAFRKEIASLKGELGEKARELQTVKGELDGKARESQTAKAELVEKVRELEVVKSELAGKARELEVVKSELAGKAHELSAVRAELSQQTHEFQNQTRELDSKARELEAAHHELTQAKRDRTNALDELREERERSEQSLGKRIDALLPERARGGVDFVVSLVESRLRR
ncbi:hypothetical protein [Polyangium spumosum]|uniref:Uncharacterized protein n=1 Tax=Polyangium spumosum TaxID=889282 RepID=A0A6N7PHK1_9BACT|nr:hypothetical protein [Polyangium spumosum]MRG91448.1 hypothetical protein [Polyangium spumosum]